MQHTWTAGFRRLCNTAIEWLHTNATDIQEAHQLLTQQAIIRGLSVMTYGVKEEPRAKKIDDHMWEVPPYTHTTVVYESGYLEQFTPVKATVYLVLSAPAAEVSADKIVAIWFSYPKVSRIHSNQY